MARGIRRNDENVMSSAMPLHAGDSLLPERSTKAELMMRLANAPAATAPAVVSHLSWSLSGPRERRNRLTNPTTHPRTQTTSRTTEPSTQTRTGRRASVPNGLGTPGKPPLAKPPGMMIAVNELTIIAVADNHAQIRQRGEGNRPSGNSRIRKVPMSPTAGTHHHDVSATTTDS